MPPICETKECTKFSAFVMKLDYYANEFLYCADCTCGVLRELIDLNVATKYTITKIGHM